jgi:hypothetical protein
MDYSYILNPFTKLSNSRYSIYESAPKTTNPDFDSLQVPENQGSF